MVLAALRLMCGDKMVLALSFVTNTGLESTGRKQCSALSLRLNQLFEVERWQERLRQEETENSGQQAGASSKI